MRLFLAIELSADVRSHLIKVQNRLRPAARVSFTAPENLHLTLKFLGEVPEQNVKAICDSLNALAAGEQFPMTIGRLTCFPERGPIRIIGAGVAQPPQALFDLVSQIEATCEQHGFGREGRPYHPHITLARARDPLRAGMRQLLEEAVAGQFPGPTMTVSQFLLMESRLQPRGPEYIPVARFYIKML